jgi:uncharacterized heparinase superfamily protein
MADFIGKIRRGLRKPPRVIADRVLAIARKQIERLRLPWRRNLSQLTLLRELQAPSLDAVWQRLAESPFPAWFGPCDIGEVDTLCGEHERIALISRAENALVHRVCLLGSGPTELGSQIDWHTDFKTGLSWLPRYFYDIDYNNPERPSDVKVPWELSRLQWLMPAGQAFLLTHDDRYAAGVLDVLEQWMEANPCGGSVNWSCTMEAALRIFSWVWFFHVFHDAPSWRDPGFRFRFMRALYLHVEFTDRHIERSDVNGNHYTADAAALVVGGLFFGEGQRPRRWQQEGWRILCEEMPRQVFPDGVDFEASVPYHRLVAELFLWPAMHRTAHGLPIPSTYMDRLGDMARFSRTYSRPDGSVPLWGDADDARVLPFGMQNINDHRYLHTVIGLYTGQQDLCHDKSAAVGEVLWTFGPTVVRHWLEALPPPPTSQAFADGGFYVMRSARDHVFIDCGPLGLAGRGGHGHNDCLAFEAVLDGVPLVSDCGAYLYTASFEERNRFRSTAYHNTPQIDGEEINRFIRPDYLWSLHYDAVPRVLEWRVEIDHALFVGEHRGYCRLTSPVIPRRTILLDFEAHALYIKDEFLGEGMHDLAIPLHFAPSVELVELKDSELIVGFGNKRFRVWWPPGSGYLVRVEDARVSQAYGIVQLCKKVVWCRTAAPLASFSVFISPTDSCWNTEARVSQWLSSMNYDG